MAQTQQVRGRATAVRTEYGRTTVRYHSTDVVTFDQETVTLDTGGYASATTKLRMNQAANEYRLGFNVYQKRGQWFIRFSGNPNRPDVRFDGGQLTFAR